MSLFVIGIRPWLIDEMCITNCEGKGQFGCIRKLHFEVECNVSGSDVVLSFLKVHTILFQSDVWFRS